MAKVEDDWTDVERGLAWLDKYKRWRPTIAGMRRLGVAIRADARFHDLEPSLSHACLVFRRHAQRGVLVCWKGDDTYGVAFVEAGFELRAGRDVGEDRVLDVLLEYLEEAPT